MNTVPKWHPSLTERSFGLTADPKRSIEDFLIKELNKLGYADIIYKRDTNKPTWIRRTIKVAQRSKGEFVIYGTTEEADQLTSLCVQILNHHHEIMTKGYSNIPLKRCEKDKPLFSFYEIS
jgi:hypothetical protein